MKRRRFIQTVAAAPAIAIPATAPVAQSAVPRPQTEAPKFELSPLDAVGDTTPRFFSAVQLATLRKLSDMLMPTLNGMPGALEAGAPEFLDFLIGASAAERKQLYKNGLDTLQTQAQKKFGKAFADLNETQAGELLAPLKQPVIAKAEPAATESTDDRATHPTARGSVAAMICAGTTPAEKPSSTTRSGSRASTA